jgi:hypothetical protein
LVVRRETEGSSPTPTPAETRPLIAAAAGYPLAVLLAQHLGLSAAFAACAILSAAGLAAASEGCAWGWASGRVLAAAVAALAALCAWVPWETCAASPLVQVRLLRRRQVLSGNLTGLSATAVVAGAMLTPVLRRQLPGAPSRGLASPASLLQLGDRRLYRGARRRPGPLSPRPQRLPGGSGGHDDDRGGHRGVFAVNPIQIVDGVPASETGSSLSFYQLLLPASAHRRLLSGKRFFGGRARSQHPAGSHLPADAGYSAAVLAVLACVVFADIVLALTELSTTDVRHPGARTRP